MPWIIAVFVIVGLIGLTSLFIINAKVIKHDINQRRDAFRVRLENEANALFDDFLKANEADRRPAESPSSPK